VYTDARLVVAVDGIIYNREEILSRLGRTGAEAQDTASLVRLAYQRWGEQCCSHLHGDWSLAVWDRESRQLMLARDQFGNSALYYYEADGFLAFSTDKDALYDFGAPPAQPDILSIAQHLVSWPAYHNATAFCGPTRRLLPGHLLTATPARSCLQQYWRLEDVATRRLRNRDDYVAGFREVYTRAIRERLAATSSPCTTLSGGLDSGSVTAIAAHLLQEEGRRIDAYSSVPLPGAPLHAQGRFGDEREFAGALVQKAGNIIHHPLTSADKSPVRAIRECLAVTGEPLHGAANLFWLQDLLQEAAGAGNTMMLTGQFGNAGVSWTGDLFSRPLGQQIQELGLRQWVLRRLKRAVPRKLAQPLRHHRLKPDWARSAIAPDLARQLKLAAQRLDDPQEAHNRSALETRHYILKPGRNIGGATYHAWSRALGLQITDPTADARVLEYCLSVPDRIFIDPESGIDRWLIREATKGLLPDVTRLNRQRGRQAADLLTRLRMWPEDMEEALQEVSGGAATSLLNISHMNDIWRRIRCEDSQELCTLAVTVLLRGIMVGLFVNRSIRQG
jgi:asparagine synthase (glutamine-hydrolysing)